MVGDHRRPGIRPVVREEPLLRVVIHCNGGPDIGVGHVMR
jgi:hypothetical protein